MWAAPTSAASATSGLLQEAPRPPRPSRCGTRPRSAAVHLGDRVKETEIAFFGGSFTAIPREQMVSLLAPAKEAVERFGFRGLRCSTRPDAVDREVLSLLKAYHMTAVELGAQSMDSQVLELNHRGHTPEDTVRAAGLIREAGLELGVQMMTGLYGSTSEKDLKTAKALIALRPDTARIYPTVVLEGTPLAELYRRGLYRPQTVEEAVDLCAQLLPLFEEAGVRVIRLGLHAEKDVERRRIAGAYHPALRELVESRLFLSRLLPELEKLPRGRYQVKVRPRELSIAIGQRRANVRALEDRGYQVGFVPGEEAPPGGFLIKMPGM